MMQLETPYERLATCEEKHISAWLVVGIHDG